LRLSATISESGLAGGQPAGRSRAGHGTPPVVRWTGGLADSVIDERSRPGEGTGFAFRPATARALADACEHKWYNQTLCQVNESVVRMAVIAGEYHWHKHDKDDEFFYVIEGKLLIDLEGRTVELAPRQGFVVPKGAMHCTRAPQRTVILMVENAGIIPTGD
jgi:mannose-6-phosphate isomerase-like protein (cupin superfamily)